jgi:hypothetical protein
MKCMIATNAVRLLLIGRAPAARLFYLVLLGLTVPLSLHAADFKFTLIDYPNALATDALGINDQADNFSRQRQDYTRGDVPGSISAKGQRLKAGSTARLGQYNYAQVDVPGAVFTCLFAINSSGQTVGLYVDRSDTAHGFLRNVDGSIVTIDYPGGDVVGRWDDASGVTHSFLRTSQGTITSFDPPAPCVASTMPSAAHGVNDRGDIVGRCFDAGGKELGWLLPHEGNFSILDDSSFLTTDGWALDNSRIVVGDYSDADGFVHGFTWTEADEFTTFDFKNNMTGLRAINQRGDISGIYFDGLTLHGFLRPKNETDVMIDPSGSVETDTAVVNDSGTIAGVYWDAEFNAHGYIAIKCGSRK